MKAISGKPKTCKSCRNKFVPTKPLQVACSIPCALELAKVAQAKKQAQEATKERAEHAKRKEATKTKGQHTKEAQIAFNAFIRERDKIAGHPCISSGRPLDWAGNAVDAGHYRSVGSAPHLRFDERNCHAQSKQDNRYLSGNAVDYRIGLIARIGLKAVEALEADQSVKRYTIEDLKAIKAEYRAKLRELQK
jgi:hypothetical protein